MRVVVLCSGGVDSSVLMKMLRDKECYLFPLFVDYGQLAAKAEWEACQRMCHFLGLEPKRMNVSGFGQLIPSGLTNQNLNIETDAFVPTRNLLMLTLAAAYGYVNSAYVVAIGLLSNPIFPDQTEDFIRYAQRSISQALGVDISILSPFISLDKHDTLQLARKLGLPLESTYSCHSGAQEPCGHCISCKERIAAEKMLARFES